MKGNGYMKWMSAMKTKVEREVGNHELKKHEGENERKISKYSEVG